MISLSRAPLVAGYLASAMLYAGAWWRPSTRVGNGLVEWTTFNKLCLTEFLSLHAATLLGALALSEALEPASGELAVVFWSLLAGYAALGLGAFLFHRSHRALLGLYVLLFSRGAQLMMLGRAEPDVMRAEVVKNLAMSAAMMVMVAGVVMSDRMLIPWQQDFRGAASLGQRIRFGKPLLFVTAYYALWSLVEATWPLRLAG